VSKRLQLLCILLAGFLTTGAQWDVVQVIAWARMAAQVASTGAHWEAAVAAPFSGELCELCEAVDAARQERNDGPAAAVPKSEKSLLAVYSAAAAVELATVPAADPCAGQWSLSDFVGFSAVRAAPPSPPPRP